MDTIRALLSRVRSAIRRHRYPGWFLGRNGDEVHVLPLDDWVRHTDADCVCGTKTEPCPRDDGSMGWLVVHYALDGRDRIEGAA